MRDLIEKIRDKNILLIFEVLFIGLMVALLLLWSERRHTREVSVFSETLANGTAETETEGMSERQSEDFTPAELAMLEEEGKPSGDSGTEKGQAEDSDREIPVLLKEMWQLPAEFRIPMAMPLQEQEDDSSTELWTVKQEPGKETAKYRIVEYREEPAFRQWKIENRDYKIVRFGEYRPVSVLKKMVENRVDDYDGDWSVYVKNLKTDESFVVNDRPMKSASVMKLFVLGAVYKAIDAGELERTDEVVSLLDSMITASDNEASNRLLYLLGHSSYRDGIAKVDEFIQKYGFSDMTVEYNGFNNSDTVFAPDHNNQVSAKDCGKLLEDIYRRTWLNRAAANEAEQLMLNQDTRYKIPAGLPDGVSCGNKTGEMETTENDAAVVYAEDCDYILVVLSSDWSSKDQAISRIASMSSMVYEFLN